MERHYINTPNQVIAPPDWIGPPLSMVRFDGWNDTYNYPDGWTYPTRFQHRWPSAYLNGKLKGTGIDTVAILEAENALASNAGVTAWAFDMYLPSSIVEPNDPDTKHEWLMAGLEAYLASSNKSSMKFWVTVIVDSRYGLAYPTATPWKYLTDFSNYVANLMNDPQYLRLGPGPVIGLFSSGGDVTMTLAQWQSFLTPMGGQSAVFTVQMSGSTADFTTFGCQARFRYGIQNLTAGQGHKPFTTSSSADKTYWTQALLSGETRIGQFNFTNDARALDVADGTRTWVDMPTHTQAAEHFRGANGVSNSKMTLGIWNELAEEGAGSLPTAQDGDVYLRAIKQERTGVRPLTETFKVNAANADSAIVASNGVGWTYVSPFTATSVYHDSDYVVSSTAGDYKEFFHPRLISCEVFADKGPDCGICEIYKGGVLDQTIDCYAASPQTSVSVATVSFGSASDSSVRFRVTGTKNAASSSAQLRLDYFKPIVQL